MPITAKQPIRVRFSRRNADGSYTNLPSIAGATGMNVFRNDATTKQFKSGVAAILKKFEGQFELHSEEQDRAVIKRVGVEAMAINDVLALSTEDLDDDLPF